jgi:hypothetical protein
MLIVAFAPIFFEQTSLYPANSKTVRTAPPAIIPVPVGAGLIKTFVAPKLQVTSW